MAIKQQIVVKAKDGRAPRTALIDPYLKPGRLAEVIAAITAMGTYRKYKRTFEDWAERITNRPNEGEHWGALFAEHPEFFRFSPEEHRASLVWRRQFPKLYDSRQHREITREQYEVLAESEKAAISRRPLSTQEITALISVAVDLHAHALEHKKASKWWVPIAAGVLGFVGAVIGAWIPSLGT